MLGDKIMKVASFLAVAASLAAAAPAVAGPIFAGSWTVDQGPWWDTVPQVYTGQQAAALLFGGSASDYEISTISDQIGDIDHLAWVSTYGGNCDGAFPCGTKVAENFSLSTDGLYDNWGDQSAYVGDWAQGAQYRNYAFRIGSVPEPASWAMMVGGFGLAGAAMRRRKTSVAFA